MMRYITNNDIVSTSSLYLSHGLTWGKHRYIRREGSPGHYTYVYPEDVQKQGFISRVKSAIDSRNTAGATLLGNPINRRAYQNKSAQVSRMERNYNKAVRQVERSGRSIAIETSKATDPSRSEEYRGEHQEKLKKLRDAQKTKISALKNYESRVNEAQKRLSSVKMAYDRTRKIDDIAPSVISEFKKLFRPDASVELSKNEVMTRGIGGHSVANKTMVFWQPDGTFKRVRGRKTG